jgi:hypothetical protein
VPEVPPEPAQKRRRIRYQERGGEPREIILDPDHGWLLSEDGPAGFFIAAEFPEPRRDTPWMATRASARWGVFSLDYFVLEDIDEEAGSAD